jgi:hypothetical protein
MVFIFFLLLLQVYHTHTQEKCSWKYSWYTNDEGAVSHFDYAIIPQAYKPLFSGILKEIVNKEDDLYLLIGNQKLLPESDHAFNMVKLMVGCSFSFLNNRLVSLNKNTHTMIRERSLLKEIIALPYLDLGTSREEVTLSKISPISSEEIDALIKQLFNLSINNWRAIVKTALTKQKLTIKEKALLGIMVELVVQSIDHIEKQEERIINSKRMSDYLYDRKRQKKANRQLIHTITKKNKKLL